jgi:hypothetical protein
VGQLSYDGKPHNGVLYIKMNKTQFIFHKYFEDVDFRNVVRDVFQDSEVDNFQEEGEREEWVNPVDYTLQTSKEGVLHYQYSDHDIQIYPLNKNLFQQKLANMQ